MDRASGGSRGAQQVRAEGGGGRTRRVPEAEKCPFGCNSRETPEHLCLECKGTPIRKRREKFFDEYYVRVVLKARAASKLLAGLRDRIAVLGGAFTPRRRGPATADDLRTIALGFVQTWMTDAVEAEARAMGDDGAASDALRAHGRFMKEWFKDIWKLRQSHYKGDE